MKFNIMVAFIAIAMTIGVNLGRDLGSGNYWFSLFHVIAMSWWLYCAWQIGFHYDITERRRRL